jgi:hypothetical protein
MTLDPARVFATLDRHEVDHVTIGAFAVIAHGYVRATADIDLMARQDRDNLERLAAAFAELRARLPGVDAEPLELDPPIPPRRHPVGGVAPTWTATGPLAVGVGSLGC